MNTDLWTIARIYYAMSCRIARNKGCVVLLPTKGERQVAAVGPAERQNGLPEVGCLIPRGGSSYASRPSYKRVPIRLRSQILVNPMGQAPRLK